MFVPSYPTGLSEILVEKRRVDRTVFDRDEFWSVGDYLLAVAHHV